MATTLNRSSTGEVSSKADGRWKIAYSILAPYCDSLILSVGNFRRARIEKNPVVQSYHISVCFVLSQGLSCCPLHRVQTGQPWWWCGRISSPSSSLSWRLMYVSSRPLNLRDLAGLRSCWSQISLVSDLAGLRPCWSQTLLVSDFAGLRLCWSQTLLVSDFACLRPHLTGLASLRSC